MWLRYVYVFIYKAKIIKKKNGVEETRAAQKSLDLLSKFKSKHREEVEEKHGINRWIG